jgi:hypothetical protein
MTALHVFGGIAVLAPAVVPSPKKTGLDQMHSASPLLPNRSISTASCLSLTCLQWSTNGELSAFDLHLVLGRLARVDQHFAAIWGSNLDLEPCPSIS